ncbi:Alpha/Beta hydrolase protein [Cyathus striatus]|nr:Alpha/Beta hydrolase protein [Cyathus striatus]
MYTTGTAELPGGDALFYTDSGAPKDSKDYTTILMFHGTAFHAYTFWKLHDYAHELGIRIIVANRKGYPGSSPFTVIESDEMENGKEGFLGRIATLVANMIIYLVEHHDIPKLSADRSTGGISVLGWSMGTLTALSLFSQRGMIDKNAYNVLNGYIKDLIMYDPPYLAFGYDPPTGFEALYNPFADPESKTLEESMSNFMYWVSGYFKHPDSWSGDIFELDLRKRTEKCSVESWSAEEMRNGIDTTAAIKSEIPMSVYVLRFFTQKILTARQV